MNDTPGDHAEGGAPPGMLGADPQSRPQTESCRQCGSHLVYSVEARDVTCSVCGSAERAHVFCPAGHYVCDPCHGSEFLGRLDGLLEAQTSTSPHDIAESLMSDPALPMLGCEHAHVAAGALMRSLENAGVAGVTPRHRQEALERTTHQAIGAYCGLTGVCGVVPALGACHSVLVGARCGRGPETEATMRLVSRLATVTADHAHPGCCKAYVRASLQETAEFLRDELDIVVPAQSVHITCVDVDRHPHGCRGPECPWHPATTRTVTTPVKEASVKTTGDISGERTIPSTVDAAQAEYDRFFGLAYAQGVLDERTKILIALGASLASGCAP